MDPLRLGIITPVVTLLPGAHARWERTGTVDDVVAIATAADRLGYHHLTVSEHIAVPASVDAERGTRYWDPAATLAHLAAHTTGIRLATHVIVAGYHHPLEVVKRFGTVDLLSGGRLILGVGVGSLREEFDLLGASFDDRGDRADDWLAAVRASFGNPQPRYIGQHFRFEGLVVEPTSVQDDVPVWIGGRGSRSLRRAIEFGDGWCPFGLDDAAVGALVAAAGVTEAWASRAKPLEIVLQGTRALDPIGDPADVAAAVESFRHVGATALSLRLVHHSPAHYVEQLEAMLEVDGVQA